MGVPTIYFRAKKKISLFSSENCHFYSRKNPRLTVWAVNVMQSIFKPLSSETDEVNRCERFLNPMCEDVPE